MNHLEEYISIIHQRQQNPLPSGGEVHHIIPRSCGGPQKAKWNLIRLTTLEHIECHRLLTLIYSTGEEHRSMCASYALMCKSRKGVKLSEEQAAGARDAASQAKKGIQPLNAKSFTAGHVPWNKGKKTGIHWHWSEEAKKKLSESKRGKETWMKGRHHTEASKQKMRESRAKKGVA